MIHTVMQLKAKVRNLSGSDSQMAQMLIRNYIMERFLERVTLSPYRNNFILKGGMLVSSLVGLETRSTMDIDTTVKSLPLSIENAVRIVEDIIAVDIPDGVHFHITKTGDIMEEHDYPGVRITLEATLETMRQTIKVDISSGDVITPTAVEYAYKLMFEDRTISLWTYNTETLLAEKLETIMARSVANTRMRDFYDIYVITRQMPVDKDVLRRAFLATSEIRNTKRQIPYFKDILITIENDDSMKRLWDNFKKDSVYVGDVSWSDVMASVMQLADSAHLT